MLLSKINYSMEKICHNNIDCFSIFTHENWTISSSIKTFKINNHGIKLIARNDEELQQVIFDTEKKTVTVVVKNNLIPNNPPRTLDLSNDINFFEDLRNNLEEILTIESAFNSVTPNDDRTIFQIS